MSRLGTGDEAELQYLLKQLLSSVQDKMSAAPSAEDAEQLLLHLEETDKNFHNYELVKYLRRSLEDSLGPLVEDSLGPLVEDSLGPLVEDETEKLIGGDSQQDVGPGQDVLVHTVTRRTRDSAQFQQMMQSLKNSMVPVVKILVSRFEEDEVKKVEQLRQFSSDSDSSFNQSFAFIRQEQLQVLTGNLDLGQPRQVRLQALQALCSAPPSDVLNSENWTSLRRNLSDTLAQDDPDLSDLVLQFFSRSFSSCPLSVTREIYTSLGQSVGSWFVDQKVLVPSGPSLLDLDRVEVRRLLKQVRLMNHFQKDVASFWIRHPEMFMEEVMEATFSLLTLCQDPGPARTLEPVPLEPVPLEPVPLEPVPLEPVPLEPVHLLALLDVRASWFKKWMHGYYSRTVVLRLLETRYKSLVAAALQQCLQYSLACRRPAEETQTYGVEQSSSYSGEELGHAHFVHSLCLLGRIVLYADGRKLFPIRTPILPEPVSLTDLLVALIHILYRHPEAPPPPTPHTDCLSPGALVLELLWTLCERDQCAAQCLHQGDVLETLLEPLMLLLQGQQVQLASPAETLTLIADVLSRIVNTDGGLALFLYEDNLETSRGERTSAAHVIVQFTLRLLGNDLPGLPAPPHAQPPPSPPGPPHAQPPPSPPGPPLTGAFISLCSRLYNSCEGLQLLRPYGLDKVLAQAWRQTSSLLENVPAPGPGTSSQEMQNLRVWEETLLDGLLNFAATPRGALLLQLTGALEQGVRYMSSRCTRRLQVSRCEKFGYGVMVTQVAATAPGVRALHASGWVRSLVVDLWSALEGADDVTVGRPKPTPMEPIDRSCLKSFLSLVNLLSSGAVWTLLDGQPLANRRRYPLRDVPASVPDLMDRLVVMNSEEKIRSLFHFHQSHLFGLRLLNVLCCSLDSFLLLDTQYHVSSLLLQSQRDNMADQGVIVDVLSVERNHVLVRVLVVGGPSERILPPRALQEGERPYPWPMFCSSPPPACYTLDRPQIVSSKSEIGVFLASPRDAETDESWLDACRRHFCKAVTSDPDSLTTGVVADLLEEVVLRLSSSECFFPPSRVKAEEADVGGAELSAVEQLGVLTCVRYGRSLRLLGDDAAAELTLLMKQVKTLLSSQLTPLQGGYPAHDWLTSTVFLVMEGDRRRSFSLLLHLSCLLASAFLWPARIHASVHLPRDVAESGVPPLYWSSAHFLELLLKAEVPLVHSAFRMSGFTPSQMCLQWLSQCLWNYLDWPDVLQYLLVCLLLGPDYQVYLSLALLQHLQPRILQRSQSQELQLLLKEEPIWGFRLGDYLDFMEGLERRYRGVVLPDMRGILDPAQ